jgi:hypothetical protein
MLRMGGPDDERPIRQKSLVHSSKISYFLDDGPPISSRINLPVANPMSQELFEQYSTFCPRITRQLVDKKEISVTGCCLLADISGFTKLSSNLCNKGPSGLDTLRIVINHSFASFVDIIHQFGGDGISFFVSPSSPLRLLLSSIFSFSSYCLCWRFFALSFSSIVHLCLIIIVIV